MAKATKKKTVFISGPMRGHKKLNEQAFRDAQQLLEELGWRCIVPHDLDADDTSVPLFKDKAEETEYYWTRDKPHLDKADAMYKLAGWERSDGCAKEHDHAVKTGKAIMHAPDALWGIIAFCGLAHSGKTTSAHFLSYQIGSRFHGGCVRSHMRSFWGPGRGAMSLLGIEKETQEDTYRNVSQGLGDLLPEGHLVNLMQKDLRGVAGIVLIDDVRRENEVRMIAHLRGSLVYVDSRDRLDLTHPRYQHVTEAMAMKGPPTGAEVVNGNETENDRNNELARYLDRWLNLKGTAVPANV